MKSLKMSKTKTIMISLCFLFNLNSCSSKQHATEQSKDNSWPGTMQTMAANLERLMPYVFSRDEYNDPKNQLAIGKMIAEFSRGVDQVPRHAGEEILGKDPIVKYSISRLKSNTRQAQQAFFNGQTEYSRSVLRNNVGLCFTCHSTQNLGPQDRFSTKQLSSKFRLSPSERADYYVATRQFDKAFETLEGVVQSPSAMLESPHEQLNALRKYLFLQVRVKNNPAPAIALLNKYLLWERSPYFLAQDAQAWMNSLKAWQKEEKVPANPVQKARNLLRSSAYDPSKGYQSGMVDYLRATMLLHESLRVAKSLKDKAQIYSLLGDSYDSLAESGIWDLPEVYYEACVRTLPKSSEAQKCYKSFERSIILGFSGSAGIFIPKEERELMMELRKLSGLKTSEIERTEDTLQAE